MVLRLIEMVLPEDNARGIQQLLIRILLLAEKVEEMLDILEKNLS